MQEKLEALVAKIRKTNIVKYSTSLPSVGKYHFTDEPLEPVYSIPKKKQRSHKGLSYKCNGRKPDGLWYSWGGAWMEFLDGQSVYDDWGMERILQTEYIYKLKIDFEYVIKLRTQKDFKAFTLEFGKQYDPYINTKRTLTEEDELDRSYWSSMLACYKHEYLPEPENLWKTYLINWKKVSQYYDGIDIRYSDTMDIDCFWYSGWDCSSGCIWNKDAVKLVELSQVF